MNNQRIQITNHSDRTVTWTLERPDGRANVIDQLFLDEMSHALDELEGDKLVTAPVSYTHLTLPTNREV